MTHPLPDKAVEAAARAQAEYDGRGWDAMPRTERQRYIDRARTWAFALAAEGLVVVPAEAISYARQMANLCHNYKQSSAVDDKMRRNMDAAQSGFDRAMIEAAREG